MAYIVTQGVNGVEYDPNTGKKLSPGQTVSVSQGTYGSYEQPTNNSSAGVTLTQGQNYYDNRTGQNIGTVEYDANTGQKLSEGQQTVQYAPGVVPYEEALANLNASNASLAEKQAALSSLNNFYGSSITSLAPSSAADINQLSSMNLPSVSPSSGNITNATGMSAGTQSFFDTSGQMFKDQQSLEQSIRDQIAKSNSGKQEQSFLSKILGAKSPDQVREDAFQQTGINPAQYFAEEKSKLAEIESLSTQYNSLVAARDAQIAQTHDKMASNNFINNQIAQIERNAAPQLNEISANINAKSAVLEALRGRFNEAQSFVNQAVEDATAEQRWNLQMYSMLKEQNEELFNQISEPYKKAFDLKLDLLKSEYNRSYEEKSTVGKMMIDPDLAGAGITISDSLDSALQKANRYLQTQPTSSSQTTGVSPTSNTTKFTTTQINKGAVNAGMNIDSFKSLPPDVQNFYISSSAANMKDINQLLTDAKSGEISYQEAVDAIDSTNIPDVVADYLKSQIPNNQKTSTPIFGNPFEGGFFNNLWGGIKNIFK